MRVRLGLSPDRLDGDVIALVAEALDAAVRARADHALALPLVATNPLLREPCVEVESDRRPPPGHGLGPARGDRPRRRSTERRGGWL